MPDDAEVRRVVARYLEQFPNSTLRTASAVRVENGMILDWTYNLCTTPGAMPPYKHVEGCGCPMGRGHYADCECCSYMMHGGRGRSPIVTVMR